MRGPWDRLHERTPLPGPLPFGRGEGETSAGFAVVHAADPSSPYLPMAVQGRLLFDSAVVGKPVLRFVVLELHAKCLQFRLRSVIGFWPSVKSASSAVNLRLWFWLRPIRVSAFDFRLRSQGSNLGLLDNSAFLLGVWG